MNKKTLIILTGVAIVLLIMTGGFYFYEKSSAGQQKACTQEAKLCPDGTAVGRTGPNCEFALCPSEPSSLKITIYCVNNNCTPQEIFAGAGTLIRGCYRNLDECSAAASSSATTLDPKNATYSIEGKSVTLVNGLAEEAQATSTAKIVTRYFGNDVKADLNNDGREDVAFLLTQERGGSGVFYYVAALLNNGNKGSGTNAILLGDRIAPQTTEFRDGSIIVNYAERKPGEPFTTPPSAGVSWYFKIVNDRLQSAAPELTPNLPKGYTLDHYQVEKVLDLSCTSDSDCVTPGEYLAISRCPMTTLCLQNKCTVVCPDFTGTN